MGDVSIWAPIVVLALFAALGLLLSIRRIPPERRAVVDRFGRRRCLGPGIAVIVPEVDHVTWVDVGRAEERVVLPFRTTADDVTVGVTADVVLSVEDPTLAAIEAGDPMLAAQEVVEYALAGLVGGSNLAEVLVLSGRPLPAVRARADAVTRDFGVRVEQVELAAVELPRPVEILRWAGVPAPDPGPA